MAFSYTTVKPKKLSMGNRTAYLYKLTEVATSGSVIHTPFRKITGYLPQCNSPITSTIGVSSVTERVGSVAAKLNLKATATSYGYIIVVGLM